MLTLTISQPTNNRIVAPQISFPVAGRVTDRGMPEPAVIDSVTVSVDNGPPVQATLTPVPHQKLTTVTFSATAQVGAAPGAHTVRVTATDDSNLSVSQTVTVLVASASCTYPQSNPTRRSIWEELEAVAGNRAQCTSFYLDTLESHSNDDATEGEDHHQGLARTHQLSDGSIYFFLSHSETDSGDRGNLMQFRYAGPTEDEHVVETAPLTVAPLMQLLEVEEQHPCDMVFLPELNNADAGYLFVAEQDTHRLGVYRWAPSQDFVLQGSIDPELPSGPNLLFLDKVDDLYVLGIAYAAPGAGEDNPGFVNLYSAPPSALFPGCLPGQLDVSAFQPVLPDSIFPFPVSSDAQQIKLIKDASGQWFLLAFRGEPPGDSGGVDYVDVHRVTFSPFSISAHPFTLHVSFKPGDTSFASTGTHYVERSGRLLISSSYRWSEDQGPGDSSYVSRVDEIPS